MITVKQFPDGNEIIQIDYSDETGPFWLVVIDDTPQDPELPLPAKEAAREFLKAVAEADEDETVELLQCTDEQLEWAGTERGETYDCSQARDGDES